MKAELLRVSRRENAEITIKDAGGRIGMFLVGPGSVSVVTSRKKKRKARKHAKTN
jgi:hypothetical protein